jgi:hypothetical protein
MLTLMSRCKECSRDILPQVCFVHSQALGCITTYSSYSFLFLFFSRKRARCSCMAATSFLLPFYRSAPSHTFKHAWFLKNGTTISFILRDFFSLSSVYHCMSPFVAQNKHISKVHRENNTKIKNIERYKKFTHCSLCWSRSEFFWVHDLCWTRSEFFWVHDLTRASHNSCSITNINICNYREN